MSGDWPVGVAAAAFVLGGIVIGIFGSRLARVVDRLADRTGWGEALAGAVLLAGANSIAGMVVSVVAAVENQASLAISNSVGGIAAQTAFIVVADLAYRRANIEHAAASLTNVFMSMLMVVLLAVVVMGMAAPAWTVVGVHPATPLLFFTYLYGLRLSRTVGDEPMWMPRRTTETRVDVPDEAAMGASLGGLVSRFVGLAAVVTGSGYVIAQAGLSLIEATGLGGTIVGTFFTSITTSIPELVTAVAAVRAGALTLAVGGIVGGNTFDMLFIGVGDVVFREGSLYAHAAPADVFVVGWTMALVAIVGAGLVRRQREGIGFEGAAILALYLAGIVVVAST